jgi:hypothetical protein
MTETPDEALLRKAKAMAWALGITVYIRDDGRIYQHPPGHAIEAPLGSQPETAGRGPIIISEGASE